MKVLVIGSGAREHSLCWRLRQSKSVSQLFCAPGNPGIEQVATLVPLAVEKISDLVNFATQNNIDLTIVGPEVPLSLGIADEFERNGLRIFGPKKAPAAMEASKSFAKEIMKAAGVPTAKYETFTDHQSAQIYCQKLGAPLVLKADGLAAGKGVCVCLESQQITDGLNFIFNELKADKIVVEEFLDGVEASYIVAAAGTKVIPMATSHDYKRLLDNHRGPNTGGMGSVSPTPHLNTQQEQWVVNHIILPTLKELERRKMPFTGFLYAGLMISKDGKINVIEFNSRFGDPECQSVMARFEGDLAQMLYVLSGAEPSAAVAPGWSKKVAVTVVASAYGYPSSVRKGDPIFGFDQIAHLPDTMAFHAGTAKIQNGSIVTAGGRVLCVTALGKDLEEARAKAYKAMDVLQFNGMHVRRDIGK